MSSLCLLLNHTHTTENWTEMFQEMKQTAMIMMSVFTGRHFSSPETFLVDGARHHQIWELEHAGLITGGEVNVVLSRNSSWKNNRAHYYSFFFRWLSVLAVGCHVTWIWAFEAALRWYNKSFVTGELALLLLGNGQPITCLTYARTSRSFVLTWRSVIGQFPS